MPNGEAASLIKYSKLTLIKPSVQHGAICLDVPDLPTLQLPKSLDELKGETIKVMYVSQWISSHLKRSVNSLNSTERKFRNITRKGQV